MGELMDNNTPSVIILHKPRGSKGVWQPVEKGSKIRVTKGKGKRLKLKLGINVGQDYDLQVFLLDMERGVVCKDGFSIESAKTVQDLIEMDVKLFKVCKPRLQFSVQISNKEGRATIGKSIEFATHNSGTINLQPKEKSKDVLTKTEKRKSSPSLSPVHSSSEQESSVSNFSISSMLSPIETPNSSTVRMQIHHSGVVVQHQEVQQNQWFHCHTCGLTGPNGMCILCAVEKHKEHSIKYAGVTESPCKCQTLKNIPDFIHLSKKSKTSFECLTEKLGSVHIPNSLKP